MSTVTDFFGSKVFDDRVMKATLTAKVYNSLKKIWISAWQMPLLPP